jgi:leucyl-tRNA synthetase
MEQGCGKKDIECFIKALSPICPHLAEEFWEMVGNKPFVASASWPAADESKINLEVEAAYSTVTSTLDDVRDILKLAKIEKPKKITVIVAEKWLYGFVRKLKQELGKTYNVGELIRATMDKEHGSEISKLVPRLAKDRSKLPEVVTSQQDELKALKDGKQVFVQEFNAAVEIVTAESSDNPKAKNALPGKPAIVVE